MDRSKFLKLAALTPFAGLIALEAPEAEAEPEGQFNAWPEDASLHPGPVLSASSMPIYDDRVIEIGFKNAAPAFPELKLLNEAVKNMGPAFTTKVEWLSGPKNKLYAEYNFTQIVRTPFGVSHTEQASRSYGGNNLAFLRSKRLYSHLIDVQYALQHGKRSRTVYGGAPLSTCGGMNELGPGTPCLRVLRDLVLLTNRQPRDFDGYREEYISEFSLQVRRVWPSHATN